MEWSWLDFDRRQMEIPTTKNGMPHIVHMAEPAISQLLTIRKQQATAGRNTKFVFTTTGKTPASGVSKAKTRLDTLINEARAELGKEPMPHWVLHDFRRSQATALAEAGFAETVVDRLQNHVAVGSRPSQVAQVYQLADMLDERARALDYWASLVTD
jgi:integrase